MEIFADGMIMRDIMMSNNKEVGWKDVIKDFADEKPKEREKDIRLPNRGKLDETINTSIVLLPGNPSEKKVEIRELPEGNIDI